MPPIIEFKINLSKALRVSNGATLTEADLRVFIENNSRLKRFDYIVV